jgi:S-adenosylmethionine hydrolase
LTAVISFLSDYGLEDEFVGVVHRVIAGSAPGVAVVDITHQIPPHDVRTGALVLWRCAPWLVPGVILAVVDPGVGTDRAAVAVTVGEAGATLVGPDNGLLPAAARSLGAITSAVDLAHHPTGRGATFAGRELFAPAAARIAGGADPRTLGASRDPATLQPSPVPVLLESPSADPALAEVLWVDRFGNAQINISAHDPTWRHDSIDLCAATGQWRARWAHTYADLQPGEIGLVHDSYDLLSVSLNGSSAAALTGLRAGDPVSLSRRG